MAHEPLILHKRVKEASLSAKNVKHLLGVFCFEQDRCSEHSRKHFTLAFVLVEMTGTTADTVGCIVEIKINHNLFCISLDLHYL